MIITFLGKKKMRLDSKSFRMSFQKAKKQVEFVVLMAIFFFFATLESCSVLADFCS